MKLFQNRQKPKTYQETRAFIPKKVTKLRLTNEIEALFFECLVAEEDVHLDFRKRQIITTVFMAQFPKLHKHARDGQSRPRLGVRQRGWWFYGGCAILIVIFVILLIQKYA